MKAIITAKVHDYLVDQLKQRGYRVIYDPRITYEELAAQTEDVCGLVVTTRIKIDKEIIEEVFKLSKIV